MTGVETLERIEVPGRGGIACARHEVRGDAVVVFCHGFRGERTGPNRTFVLTARRLAAAGVSSLRFDQIGSGDSDGEFVDSRFAEWVDAIRLLARRERAAGRRVALLGQSMGASAALCAAADLDLAAVVAWVPDANVDPYEAEPDEVLEEGGQRIRSAFWVEAHAADVAARYAATTAPVHLVLATADEYVSAENRAALASVAKPDDVVDVREGWPHSAWTAAQADDVIDRSVRFLGAAFERGPD